jgi:hypothetical protein
MRTDSNSSTGSIGKHKHSKLERTDSASSLLAKNRPGRLEKTDSVTSIQSIGKAKPMKLSFALIAKQALERKKGTER